MFTVQFDLKLELRDNRADDVVWVMGIYLCSIYQYRSPEVRCRTPVVARPCPCQSDPGPDLPQSSRALHLTPPDL